VSTSKVKQDAWIESLIQNMFIKYHGPCLVCGKKRVWWSREARGAWSSGGERWKELGSSEQEEETVFARG